MVKPEDKPVLGLLALLVIAVLALCGTISFSKCAHQPPANQSQSYAQGSASSEQPDCESFWQRTVADPINLFTAILAVFTIALVGASIWQGSLTRQTIDLARDDFTATHRPWMTAHIVIGPRGLVFDQNGATLSIVARCKNVGNTPAINAAVHIRPFFWPPDEVGSQNFALEQQRALCDEMRARPANVGMLGKVSFQTTSPLWISRNTVSVRMRN